MRVYYAGHSWSQAISKNPILKRYVFRPLLPVREKAILSNVYDFIAARVCCKDIYNGAYFGSEKNDTVLNFLEIMLYQHIWTG